MSTRESKWKKLDKGRAQEVRLIETDQIHKLAKAAILDDEALSLLKPEYRAGYEAKSQ